MNTKEKEKLGNRAAYIVLALLAVAIIAVTVIAIATAVGNRGDGAIPDDGIIDDTPANTEPDGDTQEPPSTDEPNDPGDGEETPQPKKYHTPASGGLQKGYSEDVLVFSATMNDHRVHLGFDIAGNIGDPVYALTSGTVEKIFSDPFMGKTVVINHGDGLKSHYMNLAETLPEGITEGATVEGGSVIGAIGETAISECADEPHLHFEVFLNNTQVDPAGYITVPTLSEDENYEDIA